MPKCWADRLIMFCVIGLVAWAIVGLPALRSFWPAYNPAYAQTSQQAADSANAPEPWLTKDATGFFTFLLVAVGSFQVGLFLWQLWLIRESLDDAKLAAEAAKELSDAAKLQAETARETLHTMQDTAIRQLRAYVSVYPAALENIHPDHPPIFSFAETNNGLTPAYGREHRGMMDILPHPLPESFIVPELPISRTQSRFTLFPKVTPAPRGNIVPWERKFLQAEWIEIFEAKEGGRRLYVFGQVSYKDCFKKERWTKFCFYFPGHAQALGFVRQGNWAAVAQIAQAPGVLKFVSAKQHNETEEG